MTQAGWGQQTHLLENIRYTSKFHLSSICVWFPSGKASGLTGNPNLTPAGTDGQTDEG